MKKSIGILLCLFVIAGCGPAKNQKYHYMVAKRVQVAGPQNVTLSIIRRYEKKPWCESEAKSYNKEPSFTAECLGEKPELAPMFETKATGEWYSIRRMGAFPPSIIKFDFTPAIPDELMLAQLKALVPHAIQFAALHKAPAQMTIVAPDGTQHH